MGGAGRERYWLVTAMMLAASAAPPAVADAGVPAVADAAVAPVADAAVPPVEPATCVDDAFEPNNSTPQATPLTPGVRVDATACSGNVDLYRFSAPVPAGSLFLVTVAFTHALGDIDARLISFSSGAVVAVSQSAFDNERLVAASDGGDYGLLVYLFGGVGNTYSLDVVPIATHAESDCCTASGVPGCTVASVNDCVCLTDAQCCAVAFDDVCVIQASAECGAACPRPAPVSDCCSASETPGCSVPAVQACVCDIDAFCCGGTFDPNCVNLAGSACGATCPRR